MGDRRLDEFSQLCADLGIEVLSVCNGGKHFKAIIRAPDGRFGTHAVGRGNSHGDHRAIKNQGARLRRWVRGDMPLHTLR